MPISSQKLSIKTQASDDIEVVKEFKNLLWGLFALALSFLAFFVCNLASTQILSFCLHTVEWNRHYHAEHFQVLQVINNVLLEDKL